MAKVRSSYFALTANDFAQVFEGNDGHGIRIGKVGTKYLASFYAVLALQDFYSGNSTWNETVTNGLLEYNQQYGLYGKAPNTLNSDAIYWGLVFFYAYRSYNQSYLLQYAEAAYNMTYMNGFISPDNPSTSRAGSATTVCNGCQSP